MFSRGCVTYRIQRDTKANSILFTVSGEMTSDLVKDLQELLGTEGHDRIILDLKEVTLVDQKAVQFLANAKAAGIRIVNTPGYVRRWIIAEKAEKIAQLHSRVDRDREKP